MKKDIKISAMAPEQSESVVCSCVHRELEEKKNILMAVDNSKTCLSSVTQRFCVRDTADITDMSDSSLHFCLVFEPLQLFTVQ